jgi:hypothetical protein
MIKTAGRQRWPKRIVDLQRDSRPFRAKMEKCVNGLERADSLRHDLRSSRDVSPPF